MPTKRLRISPADFDAFAFDLDGVVTDTAKVHLKAWKRAFDDLFARRAGKTGTASEPFTPDEYRSYIDGRPRHEAIRVFLATRGLELPEGSASDGPEAETVRGLGARKNDFFRESLRTEGVDIYPSTVALLRRLRAVGVKTAVVSASRNCREVLRAAGIDGLFDTSVDGLDAEALGLRGKPAPDAFLEAARRLGTAPGRTVVVEDAIAGVAAARAGQFGLVVGVDRTGHAADLRTAGADIIVDDLGRLDLSVEDTGSGKTKPDVYRLDPFIAAPRTERRLPAQAAPVDPWLFAYDFFDPAEEGRRETLFAVGNGYFVTRGAAAEAHADDIHYPGTYLAGGYNRNTSIIDGRSVEHEDLVNLPNWLPLTFRIDGGDWFDLRGVDIRHFRQELDLRRGLYVRRVRVRDPKGRETSLTERRFVHMGDKHLAGQRVAITAENWSGRITVRALLDGDVNNRGVPRYRQFNDKHLRVRKAATIAPNVALLDVEMTRSQVRIVQAARIDVQVGSVDASIDRVSLDEPLRTGYDFHVDLERGASVSVEKVVALYTSRDSAIADPVTAATKAVDRAERLDEILESHTLAWEQLWRRCDLATVEIPADEQHKTHLALRLHIFHLLQSASHHTADSDAGIPARGWHGEAYRGHIFWDELFVFPFLNLRLPALARGLLLYRYRRLAEARSAAAEAGYGGAMFPWQSGSDGREETDVVYYNPHSGNWIRDNTRLQRHVGSAIAYNVWQYYQVTGDSEFLYMYGAELMFEIARFWTSAAKWNSKRDRYDICRVMGPDEFHDRYPDREEPGLDNNAYTNIMAAWCIARAVDLFEILPRERCRELCETLQLQRDEIVHWEHVSRALYVPFGADGIISQFEGYERLKEFDWDTYRRKYPNIMRLDLLLEAEGDSPNHYKLSKQADVLTIFYLFSSEELKQIFARLGYAFDPESIPRTVDYYLRRTSHGSTLSGIVHAWVLARSCRHRAWSLFKEALRSDIGDIQGGTTREGVHLGAMAGTLDLLQRCFTGLEPRGGELRFHPALPDELRRLSFLLRYRSHTLTIDLTPAIMLVASDPSAAEPITIIVDDQQLVLSPGEQKSVRLATTP